MDRKEVKIRSVVRRDMLDVIELLQSMSDYKVSINEFDEIWDNFSSQKNVHSVVAHINHSIVGYGTVAIETKIRGSKMGHVGDIVSHTDYRKKGIGEAILDALFEIAKSKGCYKVALECKVHNASFYSKCNYEVSGLAMQRFVK
jgi:glucosamine-phosphate N-acetyltransferase